MSSSTIVSRRSASTTATMTITARSRAKMIFRNMSPMTSVTKSLEKDEQAPSDAPETVATTQNTTVATAATAATAENAETPAGPSSGSIPKRTSYRRNRSIESADSISSSSSARRHPQDNNTPRASSSRSLTTQPESNTTNTKQESDSTKPTDPFSKRRESISRISRTLIRSLSPSPSQRFRSRSRSRERHDDVKPTIVAVTSCRSDAYHFQKAPGSTSRLPRKAPSVLKLFHELATGVKDAYEAIGAMPQPPKMADGKVLLEVEGSSKEEVMNGVVLWEFIGNLDFLLALVDEVSVDTQTRGALKDDTAFKSLRDVIKKCNKVLENMLVRRERKYTLFFQLVQPNSSPKEIQKIKNWNSKVEKAVVNVTQKQDCDTESVSSIGSGISSASGASSEKSIISRGRSMLPSAGKVRARRATPTPRLRARNSLSSVSSSSNSSSAAAAEDGFSAVTTPGEKNFLQPVTEKNLKNLQNAMEVHNTASTTASSTVPKMGVDGKAMPVQAKEELVDVIRGLRVEKQLQRAKGEGGAQSPSDIKPNWNPKANVPDCVPKLPSEYIHRHRLMKQVVNCLLDRDRSGTRDNDDPKLNNNSITSITSRHADKAGNGKTTLAIATIQTIEVRERFPHGIIWLKLGRNPLDETQVRDLYEELYRQLALDSSDATDEGSNADSNPNGGGEGGSSRTSSLDENSKEDLEDEKSTGGAKDANLGKSRRKFQGGELEGMKEDLGKILTKKRVLLCLDDVWSVEDVQWFLFEKDKEEECPFRILVTTRQPGLLGPNVQEVFVRIFSEHEAVKLLLSSAGRRPYATKTSAIFQDARIIVKGCGNSPLAIRLAGGMLRRHCSFTLFSPTWTALVEQSRLSLEEATKVRSFSKALGQIVDLTFNTIDNPELKIALRRCFVTFAVVFNNNEWLETGRGINQEVILSLFGILYSIDRAHMLLQILERMHLLERARSSAKRKEEEEEEKPSALPAPRYLMHDSVKALAQEMALRRSPCFSPTTTPSSSSTKPTSFLRNAAKYLSQLTSRIDEKDLSLDEPHMHEIMVAAVTGGWDPSQGKITWKQRGGLEDYIVQFLPGHLTKSHGWQSAGELLVDKRFIAKRVQVMGSVCATRRQVADLIELKRDSGRNGSAGLGELSPSKSSSQEDDSKESPCKKELNMGTILRDGSRRIVDEVYRVDSANSSGSSCLSLNMAICLSSVGEGLLRCKQPRDAMLRLEEAVGIFRGLLGPYHVDVARALSCVAKAYAKIGESRVALLKFGEAARIYEACNAIRHYDSLANTQSMAALLVEFGDFAKAETKYEELIRLRQSLHGRNSYQVARTINDYATILAKNGKVDEAIRQYEEARNAFKNATASLVSDGSVMLMDDRFDVVMIDLNIASIKAKKGDLGGAITSYENVVRVLKKTESQMNADASLAANRDFSLSKHLIVAMGRIGSLKLKQGDTKGSLIAFEEIIKEMKEDSPTFVKIEVSRAHIKCATIYRQDPCGAKQAILHLKQALKMYTGLYGGGHRDTQALENSLRQWQQEEGSGVGSGESKNGRERDE